MHLEGKIALVTGASRGIGREISLKLAEAGADVVCVATRAGNAADTVREVEQRGRRALAIGARVEQSAAVEALFAQAETALGPVDVLVNNAGVAAPKPILEMNEADYDQVMNVNAKSVFLCSKRAAQSMKDRGSGGVIVNIGSIAGINAFPQRLGYCASKAAMHHMTRVMAIEWAPYHIRVNGVAPGYILTDIPKRLIAEGVLDEGQLTGRIPQRRLGTPRDVAEAVLYLTGDAAAYITGSVLTVDGGWVAYGYL